MWSAIVRNGRTAQTSDTGDKKCTGSRVSGRSPTSRGVNPLVAITSVDRQRETNRVASQPRMDTARVDYAHAHTRAPLRDTMPADTTPILETKVPTPALLSTPISSTPIPSAPISPSPAYIVPGRRHLQTDAVMPVTSGVSHKYQVRMAPNQTTVTLHGTVKSYVPVAYLPTSRRGTVQEAQGESKEIRESSPSESSRASEKHSTTRTTLFCRRSAGQSSAHVSKKNANSCATW